MISSISELIAFLKQFHRHWLDDPSLEPALVPNDLPAGLAMVYRELGALVELAGDRTPFAAQDALMAVSRLKRIEGMLEFAWENQGNWSARCATGQADPPVYSNAADAWQEERRGFVQACDSLNHFLTTLCLQEAVMSCARLVALDTDRSADQVLRITVQPLWLNGCYVNGEPDHQFYVSPDLDVLVMDWGGIWVGSPSRPVANLIAAEVDFQELH